MNRIADLRTPTKSLEDAKILAQEIAMIEKDIAVLEARTEKKIAELKAKHEAAVAASKAQANKFRQELALFIDGNRHLFKSPRKIKTEFAEFGLQAVSEVEILDIDLLFKTLLDNGYNGCYEVVRKPIKAKLKEHLKVEPLPGARLIEGDTAVIKVKKEFLQEAVSNEVE